MRNTPRELTLVKKIQELVRRHHPRTVVGLGDDGFVYQSFAEKTVIAQDMMIEDVHFTRRSFSPADLGYKSLAVNLSDLAAMGARPHFAQVSLALPADIDDNWVMQFYAGLLSLADPFRVEVVGGDLTRSPGPIVVDVSVVGEATQTFSRHGARPGDELAVTNPLGLSHTGRLALEKELYIYAAATQQHLRPKPRLDVSEALHRHKIGPQQLHAVMDCSDGLINDLLNMTQGLKLGVLLDEKEFPIDSDTAAMALSLHQNPVDWFLWGGEDYELLLAIPPSKKEEMKSIFEAEDLDLFWIGKFNDSGQIDLKTRSGECNTIDEFKGWSHFQTVSK